MILSTKYNGCFSNVVAVESVMEDGLIVSFGLLLTLHYGINFSSQGKGYTLFPFKLWCLSGCGCAHDCRHECSVN